MPSSACHKKHDVKFGGESLADSDTKVWDLNGPGTFTYNNQPSTAILEAAFPQDQWNNPVFFNDTATPEIYTLSLHDALPISRHGAHLVRGPPARRRRPAQPGAGG